jgi:hypothetical protein
MKFKIIVPVLLAAFAITPASANWFANQKLGINRNVGSAPSPTPEQVRANRQPPFVLQEQANPVSVAAAGQTQQTPPQPVTIAQAGAQTQAPAR